MFEPGQIRCIAFDAVGTVMYAVPPASEVYHQLSRRYGSQHSAEEVARRFRQAFHDSEQGDAQAAENSRYATSEQNEFARWKQIVTQVLDDVADTAGCFQDLFQHFAQPTAWSCFEEVDEVLAALQKRGYPTILASNFDRRLHSVCDGIPTLQAFTHRIVSSEVGCRKPGRKFYDALVARAGCRPAEVLMVGDDYNNDITGARQAGLKAIFVNRRATPAPDEIGNLRELLDRLP